MFNNLVEVAITSYSGTTTPDKNGKMPIMLQCIAGRMPNRNVLTGTVAERAGFEVGKTYLANVREQGVDEFFGTDYVFIKVSELKGADIVDTALKLGPPQIFTVERPNKFKDNYVRKTDAVESQRNIRIKEGKYTPSTVSNTNHENAQVVEGDSTKDYSVEQTKKAENKKTDLSF